jgi:uncharacterized protein HemY
VAKSKAYLADITLRNGEPMKAKGLIEQALQSNPKIRIAYYDLGIISTEQKAYGKAIAAFKTAIRLDTSRAHAYYRLAQVYRDQGRPALAEAELRNVARIHQRQESTLMRGISPASVLAPRSFTGLADTAKKH